VTVPDAPPPYAGVAFDCDSTLSTIEGIEELARISLKGGPRNDELRDLTRRAMDGELPLEEVYGRRLAIVRPSRADLELAGRRYVETALPGGRELVAALRALGKRVWIVSGGLLPPVRALAEHLGVPPCDVRAVDVKLDADGAYAGFDEASPLARAGGKPIVLRELAASLPSDAEHGRRIALVGDGATDLEAAPVLARFVAFGGVERRESVFAEAAARSTATDLRELCDLLLTPDEIERSPALRERPSKR